MAKRPYFLWDKKSFFIEKLCDFKYYTGFAISQKLKSINSLHEEIQKKYPDKRILEISTKSQNPLGYQLSAFNLKYKFSNGYSCSVENVFQSSKVFENNAQFIDLLYTSPKEAKTDMRLKTSGNLKKFILEGAEWELNPKSSFYDYIYISALMQNKNLCDEILKFDIFTDIEFNPKKSINCQARSVAIFVSLSKLGLLLDTMENKESFLTIYDRHKRTKSLFEE